MPASTPAARRPRPCCGRRSTRAPAARATAPAGGPPAWWDSAPGSRSAARAVCPRTPAGTLPCPAGVSAAPGHSSIHLAHHDVDRRVDRDQVAQQVPLRHLGERDRKSTRLNSSHPSISYAVFCLKKKKKKKKNETKQKKNRNLKKQS